MQKFTRLAMTVGVAVVAGLLTATSNGAAQKRTERTAAPKPESFAVVQIGDDISVVKKSELKNLIKSTADENTRKKKEYDEAKKAAAKSKEKSDLGKPPVGLKVRILKGSFKTQEEAQTWAENRSQGKEGGAKSGKSAKSTEAL